ncbi:response regulator [TM7 phylum sp. oral taxon 349]|jgi:DNA-binding response OmpR family regulator|nr:response regulator [TM7 phylum sp. oral taxon 349]
MAIKTILMIEDDRFIGEMYVRSLRQAGYDVEWAIDGRDGLVMATNKTYDLVLLDIMLPELRGQEILREIKKNPVAKHSHVAVMTNFDQDEETRQEIERNVDAYFVKAEITPRRLLEIVQQIGNSAVDANE